MEYTKPYLTFELQADQLAKRGLGGNRDTLLFALESVGYYRLSGYWHIFHTDNTFHEGAAIEQVMRVYNFDRQFRLIILNALEHVEIYFRTQLAHQISRDSGAFGYLENAGLPRLNSKSYKHFIEKCHSCFERSREPFVLHYQEKYGEGDKSKLPPIWMMVNAMDFGQMVSMYKGASVKIRTDLAERFGVSARVLESWLLSLNTVRNICAHHGRLWNRELGTKPMIPHDKQWHDPYEIPSNRMFAILVILKRLTDVISPKSGWRKRLDNLIAEYPDIRLVNMGFLEGWETCSLWMTCAEEENDPDEE